VTMRSTPGSALPVVRKVRLPGINLMTLLIKTAGGRESVMVHLGRGNLIPKRSGDRYPTEFNFESLRSFRGQSSEEAIVDRRRLYRIAHTGMASRASFRIERCPVSMGLDARWTRLATFRTSGPSPLLNAMLRKLRGCEQY
jgi:hypothetical protein